MLIMNLNDMSLSLRKARDPMAGRIALIIADVTARAKEVGLKTGDYTPTEDHVASAINRGIKMVNDTLDNNPDDEMSIRELSLLKSLLPTEASEEDIFTEVSSFINTLPEKNMKQMGKVMAHLNGVFGASLNKKTASEIVKKELNQ